MASTYTLVTARFPDGTIVHANPVDLEPGDQPASAMMAGGEAVFEDLHELTEYVVHGTVAGRVLSETFRTNGGSGGGGGGDSSWAAPVASKAALPLAGDDGEARVVLADESQTDSPTAIYVWRTDEWTLTAGGGTDGGGEPDPEDDLDVAIVASDLSGLGVGDQAGREGTIRIGTAPDDLSFDFIWTGTRWESKRVYQIISQNDTWGMNPVNVAPADMTTFQRIVTALPYGKAVTFITSDVDVADAIVPVNNGTDFSVDPFLLRNYRVTPTGFSSSQFTGCTWARIDGTANGAETFPADLTPITQEKQIGGFGTVAIPFDRVGELVAAGFTFEARASAFMNGSQDGKALQLSVYWLNVDEGEDFDLPEVIPTGGLGTGLVLTGPASNLGASNRADERQFQMVTGGWSTETVLSSASKRFAIPVVVARMASGAQDNGEFYNFQYLLRPVGTP